MPTDQVELRPATLDDAPTLADLHVDSREGNVGSLPPMVHDRSSAHRWMRDRLAGDTRGWVAERAGRAVGYLATTDGWLDDLYLAPGETGNGVGEALLGVAKAELPDGFCLWVFESNEGARRFYRRHGLIELERTDGSGNEEGAPDIRMAWPGRDPLAFLRGLIDDVDDELGDLLARRHALTRATQEVKPSRERSPEREEEIVRRLAARAPELGEGRVARIVHAIITESLDAADGARGDQGGRQVSPG
ncbi:GNAT family N-acetyltransferase [Nocardioides coralli]|uniref:GNAT family N-acetyltransferase n=1 Tax=Nocardioides coralli TaxID=2872154 RepID=UPI001CA45285|nr:GNAT family N-acetyltransferase [Nocardioides coralli]QZY27947.1 GNAT family N-acetyltransferase [Nocardioides coralli]